MKLDRNRIPGSPGKYALIKVRRLAQIREYAEVGQATRLIATEVDDALHTLETHGVLDWCDTPETEAFVIRLKDKHAAPALYQYAKSAFLDDTEYGHDVMDLAKRSGSNHPHCRRPD